MPEYHTTYASKKIYALMKDTSVLWALQDLQNPHISKIHAYVIIIYKRYTSIRLKVGWDNLANANPWWISYKILSDGDKCSMLLVDALFFPVGALQKLKKLGW